MRELGFTFKERADLSPTCDASFTSELTECCFQEKHRDPTADEENDIWYKESTYNRHKNMCQPSGIHTTFKNMQEY